MFDIRRRLCFDAETNALRNPTKIHVVCTRDQDGNKKEFRNLHEKQNQAAFIAHLKDFETYVAHNGIQYDILQVLDRLVPGHPVRLGNLLDTLVLSRLIRYDIPGGHSIRAWGERAGIVKEGQDITDWSTATEDMIDRCHSDCEITDYIVRKYQRFIEDPEWDSAIEIEHHTAHVCGNMTISGFSFDKEGAEKLRDELKGIIDPIDAALESAFPPEPRAIKEVHPRVTASGAFNLNDFRWYDGDDLTIFTGGPFTRIEFVPFNPGSPSQIVSRLNAAGWKPTDKTKGHIEALKARGRDRDPDRIAKFKEFGWKVNEENLKTLPDTAPAAAFDLAKRIVLQSRLADVEEWIALAEYHEDEDDWKIHGDFAPIGAWTHRLSHSRPNMANVPIAKRSPKDNEFQRLVNDFNDKMRALFRVPKGWRLLGTDADGIQMRIFAHLVKDDELINGLIRGSKEDKTDVHSVHQRKLGEECKSRDAAKTFIYAWLLGAGTAKVAEILETGISQAKTAVENFISSYPLLEDLKKTQIPADAARGYFIGLDGRKVVQDSEHHMLAGYLQNGEAVIMKRATREWMRRLREEGIPFHLCTWPHDEWQTMIPDDNEIAKRVGEIQIEAIRLQGDELNLYCPLDGTTTYDKETGRYGGYNWQENH